MINPVSGIQRWVLINAGPEAVFSYLADLPRHDEWDEHSGFKVRNSSVGSAILGSSCERQRLQMFQAPILRGGVRSREVLWIKSLTVIGCEENRGLDFEIRNIFNGLSVGTDYVSFRLYPEGTGTVLVMTDKKAPHLPGPFHVLMLGMEMVKTVVTRPFVGILFRLVPPLRSNSQLTRIKAAVERA